MGGKSSLRRRTIAIGVAVLMLLGLAPGMAASRAAGGVRYLDEVFDDITTTKNFKYGEAVDYTGGVKELFLDVHEPAGDTATLNRPAVVWVHGGYFIRGSKEDYVDEWSQFARAGYVTIAINYRLDPGIPEGLLETLTSGRLIDYINVTWDAQHDAQAAVRWTRANAQQWRIDPKRIAIAGHSAGAITAQLVGFNSHDPGTSGTPGVSSKVAAVVASAGASLPIYHATVGTGEPPLLVSHGVVDDVVPYPAAIPSCVVTVAMGNVCEQVLDPDQDHGVFGHQYWREFLYRRMVKPLPGLQLPVRVTLTGLESLGL